MTYYERHKEFAKAYQKEYYRINKAKDIERFRAYGRKLYRKHREQCILRSQQYYQRYYALNKQHIIKENIASRKQREESYEGYLQYYLKRLMKLPDAIKRKRKKTKRKRNFTKPVILGLTIYFD